MSDYEAILAVLTAHLGPTREYPVCPSCVKDDCASITNTAWVFSGIIHPSCDIDV